MANNSVKNVCHVIGSLRVGGAEKLFVQLLNAFEGCDITALVLSSKMDNGLEKEIASRINIFYQPVRLILSPLYIFKIAYILRKMKPDVVHAHMFWASFYGVIAAKLAGVPVIVTSEHGLNPWKRKWHYFIEKWLITPCSDRRICVSNDILENRVNMDRINRNKLLYIANGINVNKYKERIYGYPCRLLAVGRLIDAKDYSVLINAMKLLKDKKIDFKLDILGDGDFREQIQEQIKSYGLEDVITLQGTQSNVLDWMYNSDVFVMSSKREGQPVSLLEAMSTGMPIVSTAVGGIPETVMNNKEALLVPAGSPELLAESLEKIIINNDIGNELGFAAYHKFTQNYSITSISKTILELYKSLLTAKMADV